MLGLYLYEKGESSMSASPSLQNESESKVYATFPKPINDETLLSLWSLMSYICHSSFQYRSFIRM